MQKGDGEMPIIESPFEPIEIPPKSISQRVFDGLEGRLDEPVLIEGPTGREITGRRLVEDVRRLAGGLTRRGFGSGTTTAMLMPNIPEFCTVLHAVLWAGGTVTTINPAYTPHEVRHQIRDSGASLLVTVPALVETARPAVEGTSVTEIVVVGELSGLASLSDFMADPLEQQVPIDLERFPALLPYSSGTTGLPKGVMLSHRNVVANINQFRAVSDVGRGDVTVAFLPFFHMYGLGVLLNCVISCGGSVVTMPRFDLEQYLRLTEQQRARYMWIVPPVALALAKHPLVDSFDLSCVEAVNSAAAPLSGALADEVAQRLNSRVFQGYGMTELSPVSHLTPFAAPKSGSSGLAVPNTSCRIVNNETGADCRPGELGELWIRGPQVMLGYLNNPQATAETIDEEGWLHTGDIGTFDDEGYLFIKDRLKELIKFKGYQIAPAELEAILLTHPKVADAAVIGMPDEESGEKAAAFIVSAGNPSLTLEELNEHLGQFLAWYKRLHQVEHVESVPKSPSGKILRRLLRERQANALQSGQQVEGAQHA